MDLGLGFRYQKEKDLFWEIKRYFNAKPSKWRGADISEDDVNVVSGIFENWTLAVGYHFGK